MSEQNEMTLQEIHEETLKLYKVLEKICDDLGIRVYVIYGTLLGAIRHQGYIPWDDDFDVVMMRPDYDAFTEYCKTHREELRPYFLSNGLEDSDLGFPISRFCDSRFRYENLQHEEIPKLGLFVDVYPFDGLGNSVEAIQAFAKKRRRLMKCLNLAYTRDPIDRDRGFGYMIGRLGMYAVTHLVGKERYLRRIRKLVEEADFENSRYVGLVVWEYNTKYYEKSWFDGAVSVPFEDTTVYVPKEHIKLQEWACPTYMQLPPVEERKPYHQYYLYRRENK